MKRASRNEIELQAKEVLSQHGLYALPIDPVQLANTMGVRVNNAKFSSDSLAAMISKQGNSTRILVEQSDPPYRKRFSIAHELGHHFLHLHEDGEIVDRRADMFREKEPNVSSWNDKRGREVQANWFAAALLMPAELVTEEWGRNPSVRHLARLFNVSEEAMGYRLDTLDL